MPINSAVSAEFGPGWLMMEAVVMLGLVFVSSSCGSTGCPVEALSQLLTEHPGPGSESNVSGAAIAQGEVVLCSGYSSCVSLADWEVLPGNHESRAVCPALFCLYPKSLLQYHREHQGEDFRIIPLYLLILPHSPVPLQVSFLNLFLIHCSW